MGSHRDMDHGEKERVLERLATKAEILSELGKNRVTESKVLHEYSLDGIRVQALPDDQEGVLRISIGGHPQITPSDYCNFRGDKGKCIALLRRCLVAMESQ